MINQEIFDQQLKELQSVDVMQLAMPPDKGYMLAAVVQSAAMCLDLPETTHNFCRQFVDAFCDRYRDLLPTVVQAIESAWTDPMVTADEFEQAFDDETVELAEIYDDVFAVSPPDHEPYSYENY